MSETLIKTDDCRVFRSGKTIHLIKLYDVHSIFIPGDEYTCYAPDIFMIRFLDRSNLVNVIILLQEMLRKEYHENNPYA